MDKTKSAGQHDAFRVQLRVKFRNIENRTLTGLPLWSPGLHFGDASMALIASSSSNLSIPLTTFTLLTDPSRSTTKVR